MTAKLFIIVLATIFTTCSYPNYKSNEIEYRGQKIKLTKPYSDFDTYKNDPDNIDPSETIRVQRLVMEAPIGNQFKSLVDASRAVSEIAFPGYGSGGFQQQAQPDGSVLMGFSVEIPRAEKDRCFAFRQVNGEYRLIDDFIAPEFPSIARVNEENGLLVYRTAQGERILSRPLVHTVSSEKD